jgi:hypothetical protein
MRKPVEWVIFGANCLCLIASCWLYFRMQEQTHLIEVRAGQTKWYLNCAAIIGEATQRVARGDLQQGTGELRNCLTGVPGAEIQR